VCDSVSRVIVLCSVIQSPASGELTAHVLLSEQPSSNIRGEEPKSAKCRRAEAVEKHIAEVHLEYLRYNEDMTLNPGRL
jgi:hypothetical protein